LIEWLSSKVAVAIAVVVIIASVAGYFAMQRDTFSESEVDDVAFSLARWLEAFSMLGGQVQSNVTFTEWGSLELPAAVDGQTVVVNVTLNSVIVTCGGYIVVEEYSAPVHLWEPVNRTTNVTAIADMDLAHGWTGNVSHPAELTVERKELRVAGQMQLLTFCYVENDDR
jgi:hypothetical protein